MEDSDKRWNISKPHLKPGALVVSPNTGVSDGSGRSSSRPSLVPPLSPGAPVPPSPKWGAGFVTSFKERPPGGSGSNSGAVSPPELTSHSLITSPAAFRRGSNGAAGKHPEAAPEDSHGEQSADQLLDSRDGTSADAGTSSRQQHRVPAAESSGLALGEDDRDSRRTKFFAEIFRRFLKSALQKPLPASKAKKKKKGKEAPSKDSGKVKAAEKKKEPAKAGSGASRGGDIVARTANAWGKGSGNNGPLDAWIEMLGAISNKIYKSKWQYSDVVRGTLSLNNSELRNLSSIFRTVPKKFFPDNLDQKIEAVRLQMTQIVAALCYNLPPPTLAVGLAPDDLRAKGVSAVQAHKQGYTLPEMRAAGWSVRELRTQGFSVSQMRSAGVSALELRQGGWNVAVAELQATGYNVSELRAAGYNVPAPLVVVPLVPKPRPGVMDMRSGLKARTAVSTKYRTNMGRMPSALRPGSAVPRSISIAQKGLGSIGEPPHTTGGDLDLEVGNGNTSKSILSTDGLEPVVESNSSSTSRRANHVMASEAQAMSQVDVDSEAVGHRSSLAMPSSQVT